MASGRSPSIEMIATRPFVMTGIVWPPTVGLEGAVGECPPQPENARPVARTRAAAIRVSRITGAVWGLQGCKKTTIVGAVAVGRFGEAAVEVGRTPDIRSA